MAKGTITMIAKQYGKEYPFPRYDQETKTLTDSDKAFMAKAKDRKILEWGYCDLHLMQGETELDFETIVL